MSTTQNVNSKELAEHIQKKMTMLGKAIAKQTKVIKESFSPATEELANTMKSIKEK